jgi:hypothetical protein
MAGVSAMPAPVRRVYRLWPGGEGGTGAAQVRQQALPRLYGLMRDPGVRGSKIGAGIRACSGCHREDWFLKLAKTYTGLVGVGAIRITKLIVLMYNVALFYSGRPSITMLGNVIQVIVS